MAVIAGVSVAGETINSASFRRRPARVSLSFFALERPNRLAHSIGMARAVAAFLAVVVVAGSCRVAVAAGQPGSLAPTDFVALREIDPTVLLDIRYFTAHNFIGDPVDGYRAPMCILTRAAAQGLKRAQQQLVKRGYTLKVYDCYRPQQAVNDFLAWAQDLSDQRMKAEFYPGVDKSILFRDGYIAERSAHSRGSTVDLTLVRLPLTPTRAYVPGEPLIDCTAPAAVRFPDDSIDMGTGFDCFDTLAHTLDPHIQGEQLQNRLLLKDVLQSAGFINYENEWWHFTYQPEPYPDTYFDFPVEASTVAGPR